MEMTPQHGLEASDALILERFFRSHRTTSRTTGVPAAQSQVFSGELGQRGLFRCAALPGKGRDCRRPALGGEVFPGPEGGIFNAGILIINGLPSGVVHVPRLRQAQEALGRQHGGTGTTAVNAVHRGGGDGGNKRGQYRQPILQQPDLFSAAAHL